MAFSSEDKLFFLNGSVNTKEIQRNEGDEKYDYKFEIETSTGNRIPEQDLQVPGGEEIWKIGLTQATFTTSNPHNLYIPHPDTARTKGIYNFYDVEYMYGALPFFPVGYHSISTSAGSSKDHMKTVFQEIYNAPGDSDTEALQYIAEHYQKNLQMYQEAQQVQYNGTLLEKRTYYERAMSETERIHETGKKRSPIVRWNVLDELVAKYPQRFAENTRQTGAGSDQFGYFTFKEICDLFTAAGPQTKMTTVNGYFNDASNDRIQGLRKIPNLFKQNLWNQLYGCSVTLEQLTGELARIELNVPANMTYVGMGEILLQMFGLDAKCQTEKLYTTIDSSNPTHVMQTRGSLGIVYDAFDTHCICMPCSISILTDPEDATKKIVAPKISLEGAKDGTSVKTGLWILFQQDINTNTDLPNKEYERFLTTSNASAPHYVQKLVANKLPNLCHSGDLYFYTNLVNPTFHIGDRRIDFLAKTPCPRFSPLDFSVQNSSESTLEKGSDITYTVKNPVYVQMSKNFNLRDTKFTLWNVYGDPVHAGIVKLQFLIRKT